MLKIQCHGQMLLMMLMVKKLLEPFMKKNFKKQTKNLGLKKWSKKGNKLYFKWKRYDHSFNSWIDRNDII